jgi:biotin carboxyl carrier protein
MKYVVKVADQTYEVEIEDIAARPVVARVDGQVFEVNPDSAGAPVATDKPAPQKQLELSRPPAGPIAGSNTLTAPLPGTVMEIFVKAGEQIESGQVVLVIEAMKMKNSIRSTRAGNIAEVMVNAGETVAHKQALVRFE